MECLPTRKSFRSLFSMTEVGTRTERFHKGRIKIFKSYQGEKRNAGVHRPVAERKEKNSTSYYKGKNKGESGVRLEVQAIRNQLVGR